MRTVQQIHAKAAALISKRGSKCTIFSNAENTQIPAFGLIVEPKSTKQDPDSFISSTTKICYLTTKLGAIQPVNGDLIQFESNDYTVVVSEPIVIGDLPTGVVAFKATVSP